MRISLLSLALLMSFTTEAAAKYKVKWLLAHDPVGLFKEAAEVFSKEVSEKTKGEIAVEVLTVPEFEEKYNEGKRLTYSDTVDFIQNGKIEMSQTYTTDLGRKNNKLWVLDLPFLFKDHDHAQKVLEGKVGENLLDGLRVANIQGLAFTYSGGYRVIPAIKKIEKVSDFKGMKVRTSTSPVAQDTFEILGAKPVALSLKDIEVAINEGKIDSAESTYPRYFSLGQENVAKIMNETNHSLFLTSIIVNQKFYDSLPPEYQSIVRSAATTAARLERKRSIESGLEVKNECAKKGIPVITMSKNEVNKFKAKVKPLYKKYEPIFTKELISEIQSL